MKQMARRCLDDALAMVFDRSCATNNLDAAVDLLAVLEKWHDKRKRQYGCERLTSVAHIKVMRDG